MEYDLHLSMCMCTSTYLQPPVFSYYHSDTLSTDDLATLQNALYEVRDVWFKLGVQLKVQIHDLRAIRAECSSDLGDCLLEMLSRWLSNTIPAPTWQTLVDALCCTAVGKQQVYEYV